MVVSKVVNYILYIVYLLVLNPKCAIGKITLGVERVNKVISYSINLTQFNSS